MIKVEFLHPVIDEYLNDEVVRLFDFEKKDLDLVAGEAAELICRSKTLHLAKVDFCNVLTCDLSLRLGGEDLGFEGIHKT